MKPVSSTPLWVPLVVAGIGVAGTLAGGLTGTVLTQRRADRREDAAWARQREREQRVLEDQGRTFEHRREAYLDFYVAAKALARMAYDHSYGFTEPELSEGWQDDAAAKLARLEFYADRELATAASAAYGTAWSWGQFGKYDDPDDRDLHERQQKYDDAELTMLGLMRKQAGDPRRRHGSAASRLLLLRGRGACARRRKVVLVRWPGSIVSMSIQRSATWSGRCGRRR